MRTIAVAASFARDRAVFSGSGSTRRKLRAARRRRAPSLRRPDAVPTRTLATTCTSHGPARSAEKRATTSFEWRDEITVFGRSNRTQHHHFGFAGAGPGASLERRAIARCELAWESREVGRARRSRPPRSALSSVRAQRRDSAAALAAVVERLEPAPHALCSVGAIELVSFERPGARPHVRRALGAQSEASPRPCPAPRGRALARLQRAPRPRASASSPAAQVRSKSSVVADRRRRRDAAKKCWISRRNAPPTRRARSPARSGIRTRVRCAAGIGSAARASCDCAAGCRRERATRGSRPRAERRHDVSREQRPHRAWYANTADAGPVRRRMGSGAASRLRARRVDTLLRSVMSSRYTTAAKVGLFAVVMLVAGFLIYRFVSKTAGTRGRVRRLTPASRTPPASPNTRRCAIAGIPVGTIESIRLEDGKARIDIRMQAGSCRSTTTPPSPR